jgi:hypothetical protein
MRTEPTLFARIENLRRGTIERRLLLARLREAVARMSRRQQSPRRARRIAECAARIAAIALAALNESGMVFDEFSLLADALRDAVGRADHVEGFIASLKLQIDQFTDVEGT